MKLQGPRFGDIAWKDVRKGVPLKQEQPDKRWPNHHIFIPREPISRKPFLRMFPMTTLYKVKGDWYTNEGEPVKRNFTACFAFIYGTDTGYSKATDWKRTWKQSWVDCLRRWWILSDPARLNKD